MHHGANHATPAVHRTSSSATYSDGARMRCHHNTRVSLRVSLRPSFPGVAWAEQHAHARIPIRTWNSDSSAATDAELMAAQNHGVVGLVRLELAISSLAPWRCTYQLSGRLSPCQARESSRCMRTRAPVRALAMCV